MVDVHTVYDPNLDMWPDLRQATVILRPVRVGVDRFTGKPIVGWKHVEQSIALIFSTRYHERVLRRYVGSFVPHLIGRSTTVETITNFYWAIAMAIDNWEPNYRIQQVLVSARADGTPLTQADDLRKGGLHTQNVGVYRPRGHLGDPTPEARRVSHLVSRGLELWDVHRVP